jgi:hypothetical protein
LRLIEISRVLFAVLKCRAQQGDNGLIPTRHSPDTAMYRSKYKSLTEISDEQIKRRKIEKNT